MAYTASLDFRSEPFDDPREYEETPLRDCKGPFPNLYRDDKKAEFIRDAIAMANTARLFGKPAYLFFGIDKHGMFQDITSDLQVYEQKAGSPRNAWEKVQQQIGHIVREYITPPFAGWDLKWGYYETQDHKKSYLIAYILFQPLTPVQPFIVAKDFKHELSAGQCWIRIGESKAEIRREEISPAQAPYCYAYAEVPYVLPSIWQAYFDGICLNKEVALSEAQNIVAYQELFATAGSLLHRVLEEFLASDRSLLVLSGVAGCGKSAFLRRLVAEWGQNWKQVKETRSPEKFEPPPGWIPVYLLLRGRNITATWSLAQIILDKVNQLSYSAFWEKRPMHPERLLEYRDLHWLVCLDGLDEIWSTAGHRHFLEGLQAFLEKYPRVKVILTTRPDVDQGFLKTKGDVVGIAPLTPEQVLRYIQNFPGAEDPERNSEVEEFLSSDPELLTLCQAPAYLEAAVRVLVGAYPQPLEESRLAKPEVKEPTPESQQKTTHTVVLETIPIVDVEALTVEEPIETRGSRDEQDEQKEVVLPISLGALLEQVYQRLWEREQSRHSHTPDRWAMWKERTANLALKMDGAKEKISYKEACRHIQSQEAILHLLSLGVFKRDTPETWIGFATRLTKLYFAAAFLKPYLEQTVDHAQARQYVKSTQPDFREQLLKILSNICNVNPYLIFQEVNDDSV